MAFVDLFQVCFAREDKWRVIYIPLTLTHFYFPAVKCQAMNGKRREFESN